MNKLMVKVGMVAVVAALGSGASLASDNYSLVYSKAQLSSATGVKDVYTQIKETARLHCPTYFQIRNMPEVQECRQDVMDDLVSKIDHPTLSALHGGNQNVRVASANRRADKRSEKNSG